MLVTLNNYISAAWSWLNLICRKLLVDEWYHTHFRQITLGCRLPWQRDTKSLVISIVPPYLHFFFLLHFYTPPYKSCRVKLYSWGCICPSIYTHHFQFIFWEFIHRFLLNFTCKFVSRMSAFGFTSWQNPPIFDKV